jgi:hypothetical protein
MTVARLPDVDLHICLNELASGRPASLALQGYPIRREVIQNAQ